MLLVSLFETSITFSTISWQKLLILSSTFFDLTTLFEWMIFGRLFSESDCKKIAKVEKMLNEKINVATNATRKINVLHHRLQLWSSSYIHWMKLWLRLTFYLKISSRLTLDFCSQSVDFVFCFSCRYMEIFSSRF